MSYEFDFEKMKKYNPQDFTDYPDDEFEDDFDYEYAEEFIFEDEYGDEDRY